MHCFRRRAVAMEERGSPSCWRSWLHRVHQLEKAIGWLLHLAHVLVEGPGLHVQRCTQLALVVWEWLGRTS